MPLIKAKAVLTDIEGTTTSISFVKDILFPYAKEKTRSYLKETWSEEATQKLVERFTNLEESKDSLKVHPENADKTIENIAIFVNYLIDRDLKLNPLKTLQGLVWEKGYNDGALKGHVYDDVPEAFHRWRESGARIAIYSSGSVKAQCLLFGRSIKGNLLPFLAAHFDTAIGLKGESQSYINIAESLQTSPQDILFLTDKIEEAEAAEEAGMQAIILARPGNDPLTDDDKSRFMILSDFTNLNIDTNY